MVNLLITKLLPDAPAEYAQYGLDLLNTVWCANDGDVSDNVKNLILYAEDLVEGDLVEERIQEQQSASARELVTNPTPSLLSISLSGSHNDTAATEKDGTEKDAPKKDASDKKRPIIHI